MVNSYKRRLRDVGPSDGGETDYDVITVVFTDPPAHRAQNLFDEVLGEIAVPSYAEDGIVFGPFFNGNPATAIYDNGLRPFQSPVSFIFVRHGVVGDWKFFIDMEDWLALWARRFGEQGVAALAAELRRHPWNARRDWGRPRATTTREPPRTAGALARRLRPATRGRGPTRPGARLVTVAVRAPRCCTRCRTHERGGPTCPVVPSVTCGSTVGLTGCEPAPPRPPVTSGNSLRSSRSYQRRSAVQHVRLRPG